MREEHLFGDIPSGKPFRLRNVFIGSFLGGPLVAGYIIATNFKMLNEESKASKAWGITILSFVIILIISYYIAYYSNIPDLIFPSAYSVAAYFIAKGTQEKRLEEFEAMGGQYYHGPKLIIVIVIGLLISVFAGLLLANLYDFSK